MSSCSSITDSHSVRQLVRDVSSLCSPSSWDLGREGGGWRGGREGGGRREEGGREGGREEGREGGERGKKEGEEEREEREEREGLFLSV